MNINSVSGLPELGLRSPTGAGGAAPAHSSGQDFANLLNRLATETSSTIQQGEAAAIAGVQGHLPLQTVVDKVMAAERTLQAALAVRDKAVGAYQEISRMQI